MPDLLNIKDCAAWLLERGDKITPQALGRYCKKHDLIEKTEKRRHYVNPETVQSRREDYTREKMRGDHNNLKPETESPAAKPKDTHGEKSREARARKDQAEAAKTELALYTQTRDVISTAEFELLIGLLITLIKDSFFGVSLSDMTDEILTINNLPDAQKKPTQSIIKKFRRDLLTNLSDLAEKELAALDPDHAETLPDRLKFAAEKIQKMRDKELAARTKLPQTATTA